MARTQILKFVSAWAKQRGITECWIAQFPAPFLLPSDYGVPCKLLPTLDTMYEYDIALPGVVHGPLLISLPDLNGFEFGTKVRNPYQKLFGRKPDEIIADGVAVLQRGFYAARGGRVALHPAIADAPEEGTQRGSHCRSQCGRSSPSRVDENLVLGDAPLALGKKTEALSAYAVAASRVPKMEPTAQVHWTPILKAKAGTVR